MLSFLFCDCAHLMFWRNAYGAIIQITKTHGRTKKELQFSQKFAKETLKQIPFFFLKWLCSTSFISIILSNL